MEWRGLYGLANSVFLRPSSCSNARWISHIKFPIPLSKGMLGLLTSFSWHVDVTMINMCIHDNKADTVISYNHVMGLLLLLLLPFTSGSVYNHYPQVQLSGMCVPFP